MQDSLAATLIGLLCKYKYMQITCKWTHATTNEMQVTRLHIGNGPEVLLIGREGYQSR